MAITTSSWSGYFEDFDHIFIGEEYDDGAGDAVSMTGDVNGDGYDDVLIGSPGFDVEGGLSSAGTAHLIFGGTMPYYSEDNLDDLVDTYGGARWTGINTDGPGSILTIAGDVNGDGYDDVLVGGDTSSLLRSHSGMVYLMLGATSLASGSADDEALAMFYTDGAVLGWDSRLASQTDLDGDGLSDLAMSAHYPLPGQAYVVFGATSFAHTGDVLLDADADAMLVGTDSSDDLGWALAGVEDMNGDGYDELAATSPFYTSSTTSSGGRMFLFYGSTTGWSLGMDAEASADAIVEGDTDGLYLGEAVASGDLDGDGHGDVAVSGEDTIFAFYGPLTGTTLTSSALLTIESESGWGSIGDQLLMADFTGDGVDDLVTSSPTVSAVFRDEGVGP
jgi:hypothetical protein